MNDQLHLCQRSFTWKQASYITFELVRLISTRLKTIGSYFKNLISKNYGKKMRIKKHSI